ncbi:hypothetical protein TPA0910_46220 [Streptomyces hygroscopicus subsp. sporocinereus]|uniref:Uncharacterized protein n=1 Tax=Streptomyces hygroscopicus TaxID=1912 RepID=A0ABQ3U3K1_STRHY|nr:hypothetical protein TPA0910_46220 [Streptomyces hygroscopicus]
MAEPSTVVNTSHRPAGADSRTPAIPGMMPARPLRGQPDRERNRAGNREENRAGKTGTRNTDARRLP